ncbi:MAG: DHA2 family efflux MFS transporter permease subunit [Bacillota bacterium]|nr:DHA2 family efflux MFS transporter permease subunit [Bacillota bacterium]
MRQDEAHIPWLSLSVLVLGGFMAMLQASAVNVAIPRLMAVFNTSAGEIQWVLTAYMLVSGVVIPVSGYLGDRFGYKRVYILALVLFMLGSGLAGLSWNVNSIIAARVIQAVGGGIVMPISMALLYRMVPIQKIGVALGTLGLAFVMAPAIGPTVGGYIVDYLGWRLVFYLNLPVGLIALPLTVLLLPSTPGREGLKFDLLGFVLAVTGCFCLLLALTKGADWGWGSQGIVTLFVTAIFTLTLFTLWELASPEPMLDVRLFTNPVLTMSTLATGLASVALFGAVFLVPLYTQNVQGYSPLQTGLILLPAALVSGVIMPFAGRLFDRLGAAPLGVMGLSVVTVTTYLLHALTPDMPARHLQYILAVRSVGLGLCMMPISTAGMNTVPKALVGQASALTNTVRQIAASFGIAYMTHVLVTRQAFHAERLAEAVAVGTPSAAAVQQLGALGGGPGVALSAVDGLVQRQAMVAGMGETFLVAAALAAATIPFIFFLGKRRVEATRYREEEKWRAWGGRAAVGAARRAPAVETG